MEKLRTEFNYRWNPVFRDKEKLYFFPERISLFMKEKYKIPAVYRWDIYKKVPEDEKIVYLGEAKILCPQRINGYLNPGPSQQTNKRMKAMFLDYINEDYNVSLETFDFDVITIGEFTFYQGDLENRHLRCFLEELMVVYYQSKGFTILNL